MIDINNCDIDTLDIEESWNFGTDTELMMHTLHAYPAKFPAFIATKAFEYAESQGVNVNSVADIFCGCGTVALEAKVHGKAFWGCDINPVATLIASTKSRNYKSATLQSCYDKILSAVATMHLNSGVYTDAPERLRYWFSEQSYIVLYCLRSAINHTIPQGKYRDAFLCIFSSILKASSRWLTKSIKPQIDPNKQNIDIMQAFDKQYKKLLFAVEQIDDLGIRTAPASKIVNKNFLRVRSMPKVDLIISSPPYVTSYEYADLHQLSTLWLEFADDYRSLRKGSIGSAYNSEDTKVHPEKLNDIGLRIIDELMQEHNVTAEIRSIYRYYLDIQKSIERCTRLINRDGMVFFVVGDTEYRGIKITNSNHLIQCLIDNGFHNIQVTKRRISNKLLTPFRDESGRFSSDKSHRTIYHEEFIICGRA